MTTIKRLFFHLIIGMLTITSCSSIAENKPSGEFPGLENLQHLTDSPPHDWNNRQWLGVIHQAEDNSCGAAVLATVLTYEIGNKTTEAGILAWIRKQRALENPKISPYRGLATWEIVAYLNHRGYPAKTYRVQQTKYLAQLRPPAILLIKRWGRGHYVLLRKLDSRYAWVADPASGNHRISLARLQAQWSGYLVSFAQNSTYSKAQSRLEPNPVTRP